MASGIEIELIAFCDRMNEIWCVFKGSTSVLGSTPMQMASRNKIELIFHSFIYFLWQDLREVIILGYQSVQWRFWFQYLCKMASVSGIGHILQPFVMTGSKGFFFGVILARMANTWVLGTSTWEDGPKRWKRYQYHSIFDRIYEIFIIFGGFGRRNECTRGSGT